MLTKLTSTGGKDITYVPANVGRISGPLLDRIDIHIDVPAVKFRELAGDTQVNGPADFTDKRRSELRGFEKVYGSTLSVIKHPKLLRRVCYG